MTTTVAQNSKKQIIPSTSLIPPIVRGRAQSSDVATTADKTDKVKRRDDTEIEGRRIASYDDGRKKISPEKRAQLRALLLGIPKEKKERSPEEIEARKKASAEGRKYLSPEKREALKRDLFKPLPKNIHILHSRGGS